MFFSPKLSIGIEDLETNDSASDQLKKQSLLKGLFKKSADSLFAANSKVVLVLVLASKNKLTIICDIEKFSTTVYLERTNAELDEYLQFDFFERCGGGIGVSRLMRSMKTENLI